MALVEVKVPDIGDFKEVAVIELLVKPGDTVAVDQSLITVESDKASMEIPSSHAGVRAPSSADPMRRFRHRGEMRSQRLERRVHAARQRMAGASAAQEARRDAGLQARRHVRGRVPG